MHTTIQAARCWLGRYDDGVPATMQPYPARTVLDYVAEAARERPRSPALLFKGAVVTNAELEAASMNCPIFWGTWELVRIQAQTFAAAMRIMPTVERSTSA